MYYMQINKNFVHQVGNQPRLYNYERSTNYQDSSRNVFQIFWKITVRFEVLSYVQYSKAQS
jgi:DUF1680 family protein